MSSDEMDPVFALLDLWDKVDAACDRVACAQPATLSAAAGELETSRRRFRTEIRAYALAIARPGFATPSLNAEIAGMGDPS